MRSPTAHSAVGLLIIDYKARKRLIVKNGSFRYGAVRLPPSIPHVSAV